MDNCEPLSILNESQIRSARHKQATPSSRLSPLIASSSSKLEDSAAGAGAALEEKPKRDSWADLIEEGIAYLRRGINSKQDMLKEITSNLRSASMQLIHREAVKDLETIETKAQELESIFSSLREMTSFDIKLAALSADTSNDLESFEAENSQEEVDLTEEEAFENEDLSQSSHQEPMLPSSVTPSPPESSRKLKASAARKSSTPPAIIATSAAWEQRFHKGRMMFKCKWPGCNHYVQCKASIYKHRATVHGVNNDYPSECYKCGKVFANSKSLRSHLGFHTKVARLNRFYTDDEETMNTEENSLDDSEIVQHNVQDSDVSSSASHMLPEKITRLPPKVISIATSENGVVLKKYLCPYEECRQMFGLKSQEYYEHEKSHFSKGTRSTAFVCPAANCSKSFDSEDDLNFHQSESHPENSSDMVSSDEIVTLKEEEDDGDDEEFDDHQSDVPVYKCDYPDCGREFPQNISLKVHKLSHAYPASGSASVSNVTVPPYDCRICMQKFSSAKSLISHLGHHRRRMNASNLPQSPDRRRSLSSRKTTTTVRQGNFSSPPEATTDVGAAGFFFCPVCKAKKYSNRIRKNYGIISCSACTKFFSGFMNFPEAYTCADSGNCCETEAMRDSDGGISTVCKACRIVRCFENFKIGDDQRKKLLDKYRPKILTTGEKLKIMGYDYIEEEPNGVEDDGDNFAIAANDFNFDDNQFNEFGFLENNEENDVQSSFGLPSNYRLVTCNICNGSRVTDQPSQHYGQTSCRSCFDCFRRFMKKPRILVCEQNVSCLSGERVNEFAVIGCKACIVKRCFDLYNLGDRRKIDSMSKRYLKIPQLGMEPEAGSGLSGNGENLGVEQESSNVDDSAVGEIAPDEEQLKEICVKSKPLIELERMPMELVYSWIGFNSDVEEEEEEDDDDDGDEEEAEEEEYSSDMDDEVNDVDVAPDIINNNRCQDAYATVNAN